MNPDLETMIKAAMAGPQNLGEMPDADAFGTEGNLDGRENLPNLM